MLTLFVGWYLRVSGASQSMDVFNLKQFAIFFQVPMTLYTIWNWMVEDNIKLKLQCMSLDGGTFFIILIKIST